MSRGMKWAIGAGVLILAVGGITLSSIKKKNAGTEVRMEQVGRRDLVSAVTASGKIDAKTSVDISADITGRIIRIGVREGDKVRRGQFLLQIDPAQYQAAVARAEGIVASSQAAVVQMRATRDQAERSLNRARELAKSSTTLISPEAVEQAQTALDVAVANHNASAAQLEQARAGLQEAKDNLSKTRLTSPIDGRVVRLAVEEGEVAVPGTFSRETGLLMTVADLSVILAKVQVDETDVVRLESNDSVEVAIDAFPDTTFVGRVSKISNSAQLSAAGTSSNDRAVDFDVEVTLVNPPRDVRPDLSCTARIVTATRARALSIPIIALTVRGHERIPNEALGDAKDDDAARAKAKRDSANVFERRKNEREGVFVVRNGIATFRPVKVGIAGDEYFEVLEGVKEGETIVSGTYQAIRDLKDDTKVRPAPPPEEKKGAKTS